MTLQVPLNPHPRTSAPATRSHRWTRTAATTVVSLAFLLGGTATAHADPVESDDVDTASWGMPRPDLIDVAHRGASAYAPENTLVAYEVADELGTHMAEIDVQRTADGELVLMHDVTLNRTTDVEEVFLDRDSYNVGDFTLEELRQLDAGSWFDESFAGEPIPTLGETLDLFEALELPMLLEVKSSHLYPGIEAEIAEELWQRSYWTRPGRPNQPHRLVIQSFEWDTMERSKELLPRIPHGLLGRVDESEIEDYAEWADQINPNQNTIDADYVDAVQDADLEIYVYTVNSTSDINRAIDNGVNGIISDYPDRVLEIIAEREG